MTWILAAYLLALIYLAAHGGALSQRLPLRKAWLWFALIPISKFLFALFRAGNLRDPHDLALIEIWADGVAWLLLGLSFLSLGGIFHKESEHDGDGGGGGNRTLE